MADTQTGVIAQAMQQTAPAAVGQQPAQPAAQPAAPIQPTAPAQGFGAPTASSGFGTPAPAAPAAPVEPTQPIQTDNARTAEQFQKLSEANQRLSSQTQGLAQTNELLRQELQKLTTQRQQSQQQFAPVQQVPQQPQSVLPKLEDYVEIDPRTGERFVNEQKFNAAMSDIYQKASRAEQVVQQYVQTAEQREVARQEREAFSAFPQLNPSGGQFDPRFSQQTRAIVYDSMINPQDYGGRPLGFKDAADYVNSSMGGTMRPATPAIPTPSVNEQNQVQKEQAAASVQSTPVQVTQGLDQEREFQRLVQGTRQGSDEALAVRLLHTPHRIDEIEGQQQG